MNTNDLLEQLAASAGIQPEYEDVWGHRRLVPRATKRALLAAMGLAARSEDEVRARIAECAARPWRRLLPPVLVARAADGPPRIPLTLPAGWVRRPFGWRLRLENGEVHGGAVDPWRLERLEERELDGERFVRFAFLLPFAPAPGYHRVELEGNGDAAHAAAHTRLIVVP
ncbi:MAG: 4-alpha-glucanotransferase, partial [Betaproteobacteria bacterium]|nr:4-alpha-glucanotransferase [Betaproteobacteria bacterium]